MAVDATAEYEFWVEASRKVGAGQSVQEGDVRLTRADLQYIERMMDYWRKVMAEESAGGLDQPIRVRGLRAING